MKQIIKGAMIVLMFSLSIGMNLNAGNAKDKESDFGLDFFSTQALASTEIWGVALPPYYCGCPSGIPAGCYCIVQ